MSLPARAADTTVIPLPNGVRVLTIRLPQVETACVSVFVRTGSAHEPRRLNGISHFAEHMAFKGTAERDCQRINLDAERLGAEVNAHTDKDHTAYHMRGLARHAPDFIRMLGDIVRSSTFPAAELERERQVILHEYTEDDDDPMSTAFKLFDKLCFGDHAIGQAVIGTRANITRFTRDELVDYVQRQYTGVNVIVGAAGNVDPDVMVRAAEAAFGSMQRGAENRVEAPVHIGGIAARRLSGSPQTHVVLGFPIPGLTGDYHAAALAATLFGEGMSSPLMDEIRERRGLVYYSACSADVLDLCGQFVIEASTAPEHLDPFVAEVHRLLQLQAQRIDPVDLERARNQIVVRSLRAQEQAVARLEAAALDLFTFGRVRPREEWLDRVMALGAEPVRASFERLLAQPAALAIAGKVPKGATDRVRELLGAGVEKPRSDVAPAGARFSPGAAATPSPPPAHAPWRR